MSPKKEAAEDGVEVNEKCMEGGDGDDDDVEVLKAKVKALEDHNKCSKCMVSQGISETTKS